MAPGPDSGAQGSEMAAYDGSATISHGNNGARVRVECSISVVRGAWQGLFWRASDATLAVRVGRVVKIELSDGRHGSIELTKLEPNGLSGRFKGSGPPPRPGRSRSRQRAGRTDAPSPTSEPSPIMGKDPSSDAG
jgi:hypothetical protein